MPTIRKAPETMTAKERVLRTFAFEKTDRVPIDYMANPAVHERFCKALGIALPTGTACPRFWERIIRAAAPPLSGKTSSRCSRTG